MSTGQPIPPEARERARIVKYLRRMATGFEDRGDIFLQAAVLRLAAALIMDLPGPGRTKRGIVPVEFKPVEVKGEPLSVTLRRERR